MASVYARARVLLVPSLWWESGPRVIVEALSNGIPVIGSSSGGVPEVIGDGGIILDFPKNIFSRHSFNYSMKLKSLDSRRYHRAV